MKNYFLILFCILNSICLFAQNERKIWHFGPDEAGMLFDVNNNITIVNNFYSPFTSTGNSVATHPVSGDLLFYTDGVRVVDKNHSLMPNGNGLLSGIATHSSGWSVQDPSDCNRFYVLTINTETSSGTTGNFYYSKVDMTLPGNGTMGSPLGDVITGQKNILVTSNVAEGMQVIPRTNTHDYWVIVGRNNSSLNVYLLDATGITLQYNFPLGLTMTDIQAMKYNNHGKFFVGSFFENQPSLLVDFNSITGALSNPTVITGTPLGTSGNQFAGIVDAEWSEDGTKLYLSKFRNVTPNPGGGKLYQYDLNFPLNPPSLIYNVSATNNGHVGRGLRRGPDNKIYYCYNNTSNLSTLLGVINSPNLSGGSCNYDYNQITFGFNYGNASLLPNFLEISNTLPIPTDTNFVHILSACLPFGDTISINLVSEFNLNDLENDNLAFSILNFGLDSYINGPILNYIRPSSAVVSDTLFIQICDDYCYALCDTFKLILNFDPNSGGTSLNIPPLFSVCEGDTITIDGGVSGLNYVWSTGETTQIIQTISSGQITVEASDVNGCIYTDTTNVILLNDPVINLGPDQTICNNVLLTVNDPNLTVVWNGTLQSDSLLVSSTGLQIVEVTDQNGCTNSDSVFVTISQINPVNLGNDTTICPNDILNINLVLNGYDSYLWSDGSTQNNFVVSGTGIYFVTVSDNGCFDSDTLVVNGNPSPSFFFGPDYTGCPLTLDMNVANVSYLWSTGETGNQIYIDSSGTYYLTVTNSFGCSVSDSLVVIITSDPGYFSFVPNVFSPNNDGINDVFKIAGEKDDCHDGLTVEIYNRWGQLLFSSDVPEFEWNGKDLNDEEVPDGVYYVLLNGVFGGVDISRSHTVTLLR